jgi:hypothetical protein
LEQDRSTDDHIRTAADEAGVPFISILDGFQSANRDDLFIPFDGHYSAAGTALYARSLAKELMRLQPTVAARVPQN